MENLQHIRFDWAIKKILRSKANFGILEGFLSELLKEDIKIIDILESEGNKETSDDKFNRVDILVRDIKDQLIIVEIQNTRELDYFYKILYNACKVTVEHIKSGDTYSEVKKVITVSVVYFDLGQGADYVYHGTTTFLGLHNRDILQLSANQKKMFSRETVTAIFPDHYIIKVNGFNDIARDPLDEWIYFLKNSEIKKEFKAKGLDEAREKLKEIYLSGDELRAYKYYLEQLHYEASIAQTIKFDLEYAKQEGMEEGKAKGIAEGIAEGKAEGITEGEKNKALEMARKSLEEGLSIQLISKLTGLSKEEINSLRSG
ncbi:MAG: Rpn family recombination-promoting nuclease/putative transposase [Candidatus Aminicenantes bacterium]|nr:Rpn family recombination-promoting nuclease/putative transposase [Candidatus Aminicenantes bacterium]